MPDKELEIRRQFLDEAQDYLDNLENSLLGLAGGAMNVQAVNSAMRSAHSIKGGLWNDGVSAAQPAIPPP